MSNAAMEMLGEKELRKLLTTLGPRVARRVLKPALNAAATPVVKAARANVDVESGWLKKSLGKVVKVGSRGSGFVKIGARAEVTGIDEQGGKIEPWRYAHNVELGHIGPDGQPVPPHPYLRPAVDETEAQAADILGTKFTAGVLKEAAKAGV